MRNPQQRSVERVEMNRAARLAARIAARMAKLASRATQTSAISARLTQARMAIAEAERLIWDEHQKTLRENADLKARMNTRRTLRALKNFGAIPTSGGRK